MDGFSRSFYLVLLFGITMVLPVGCRKKVDPNAPCDKVRLTEYECKGDCGNPLCGRWRWVSTSSEVDGATPDNTGNCKVLYLHHDGRWIRLVNGKMQASGRYETARKVAKDGKGPSLREEEYDEIVLRKGGERAEVDSRHAYRIDGKYLFLVSAPFIVGGSGHRWERS